MTLTEFLLARIAEDEADGWKICDPDRMRAECEAKRRIVELRESARLQVTKASDDPADPFAITFKSQVIAFDAALRAHASLYADHPDYREEWRP